MTNNFEQETFYAKLAMNLMEQYCIAPVPEHFALWYHYSMAQNKELVREMESVIETALPFTSDTCLYLYNKYVASGRNNEKTVDNAAIGAQKVLVEVLKVINDFSGETQNYNKSVDQCLDNISKEFEGSDVKSIVKQLIDATANMKVSGEKISQRLEESTKEIYLLKKNLQQVTVEAQRDFLTGLFNRKTFEKLFDEQSAQVKAKGGDLCLLMIDIDHFKQFNDKFGHLIGDEVLKIVARTLTETLKGRDVVARFGGEELIVMLPDTPLEGAVRVAELIRGAIAGKELKRKDTGQNYGGITVSMGVARFRPESDLLPTLIKRADEALYQSKSNGRNRVTRENS